MIYNQNKYSFINENKMDKIPNWMNDDFFCELQSTFIEKTAKKKNLFDVEYSKHNCQCCGNILDINEVNFCKSCITDSINQSFK